MKPGKISIPHSLNRPESSICLITADPQRAFKDLIEEETFPAKLRSQIRILGLEKVKQRYKSFEQKRQLVAEYDIFLADDRIITSLPKLLGKTAYQSSKRPMPIDLKPSNEQKEQKVFGKKIKKDTSQRKTPPPATLAKRIENALCSARVHLALSATTSVHVGFSHFEPEQIDENVNAVVDAMVEKFIPSGWKNVKSLFIKGPETAALPIWQTSELWTEDAEVLEDKEAEAARSTQSDGGKRKRMGNKQVPAKKPKLLGDESGFSHDMVARRDTLRRQKKETAEVVAVIESTKKESKNISATNRKLKSKSIHSSMVPITA